MRKSARHLVIVVQSVVVWASMFPAAAAATPGSADTVLATVNGEPVPLSRIRSGGGVPHHAGEAAKALDRMIGVELAVQEGYRMGLDETLEVRDQMGIFERDTLRDGLFAGRVAGLKPEPAQIESLTKAMTVEVRLRSAIFSAKSDADRLVAQLARGVEFDSAAKEIAANGKGKVDPGEGFIRMSELLPPVQAAVAPLAPGRASGVYMIGDQFAVSRLVERRPAPDPEARGKAEAELIRKMQAAAITKYVEELKRKHAKVDQAVYATLHFNAEKPGFDSYLKDSRPLVTFTGAAPIKVQDLADAVRKRLFHGTQKAADKKHLDRKKGEVLEDLIAKRVVLQEARVRGLDRKPEYLALRDETERELVFGALVAKVIEPEVKVTDAEIKKHYEAHRKELTGPAMARLDSIAFGSRKDAEAALAKLRAGADPAWMRTNAPGRVDPKANPAPLAFPAAPVILGDLPADLRQALAGVKNGEYRLYNAPDGTTSVIVVKELLAATVLPLERVEGQIRATLTGEKRQKLFDDYIGKLRQASSVKILVSPEQLEKMVAGSSVS